MSEDAGTNETGRLTESAARSRTGLWIGLAGALLFGMCIVVALVGAFVAPLVAPFFANEAGSAYVPESATWTHDGRFAIVQTQDAENLPMTVAIDLDTGDVREEHGVYVASVERGAPVLWLVRQTPDEWAERFEREEPYYDWGRVDEPPSELVVWDLSDPDSMPTDQAPARWSVVRGTAGWDAYLEVDVLRGALPSRLLFNNSASSGEGHKAQLPEDFGTFAFLGFSPSGEYVAVEEAFQVDAVVDTWAADDGMETPSIERRVLIIRASDGQIVVEATLAPDDLTSKCVWDPSGDRVVWIETRYAEDGEPLPTEFVTLSAEGTRSDLFSAWNIEAPAGWQDFWSVQLVGTDPGLQAVYLLVDDGNGSRIMTMDPEGVTDKGVLSGFSWALDFHPDRGFLQLEQVWEELGFRTEAISYDSGGGSRTILWSGPEIPDAAWED